MRQRSASDAMRREQRNLALHIIADLSKDARRDERVSLFLAEHNSVWIEKALDDYRPLIDLNIVEEELAPIPERLRRVEQQGGMSRAVADATIGRVQRALRVARGSVTQ